MRACKEAIREHTMRRIESMGLKVPPAWKDELYRNELIKMDIRRELAAKDRLASTRDLGGMKGAEDAVEGSDYRLRFNYDKFSQSFFDRSIRKSYKNFQNALSAHKPARSHLNKIKKQFNKEPSISASCAKNLRALSETGKLNIYAPKSHPVQPEDVHCKVKEPVTNNLSAGRRIPSVLDVDQDTIKKIQ